MRRAALWSLDPVGFKPHLLHQRDRAFPETNCYVDLWIELLNCLRLEVHACLGFTLSADFEGDQWTFIKPPVGDLWTLYGVEVQELNIYRSIPEHILVQLLRGRPVLVEVDAYYLPDTAGTSYRIEHTKTTILAQAIDLDEGRLGYFHNGGYYELSGVDFPGVFQEEGAPKPTLPTYVEFVRLDHVRRPPVALLVEQARSLVQSHLSRRPKANPIERFGARFAEDLRELVTSDLSRYHRYAFATLRQIGATSELAADLVRWLSVHMGLSFERAIGEFEEVKTHAKALVLKTARAVNAKRPFDPSPAIATMAARWDHALDITQRSLTS